MKNETSIGRRRSIRPLPLVYRSFLIGRRSWWSFLGGFLEPVFYLLTLGAALSSSVGQLTAPDGKPENYLEFLVPALLGASTMNAAVSETTVAFFFKLRFARLYEAVTATSMGVPDVLTGEILWTGLKAALYALCFLAAASFTGSVTSVWCLAAIPFAFGAAVAFASLGTALSSFMKSWEDAQLVQLITVPLLLFSGTFFPVSVYPGWLEVLVHISPLYAVNVILRGMFAGYFELRYFTYGAYLFALGIGAYTVASRRMIAHLSA